jgi:hypothetical protein
MEDGKTSAETHLGLRMARPARRRAPVQERQDERGDAPRFKKGKTRAQTRYGLIGLNTYGPEEEAIRDVRPTYVHLGEMVGGNSSAPMFV